MQNQIVDMINDIYWSRNAVMCVSRIVRDFQVPRNDVQWGEVYSCHF
jgi:hypothetical protein